MANITASNSIQHYDGHEIAIIIWYAAVGISGLIGNSFVIAVTSSMSRRNSSHLVIIWLGCTDLITCLFLPFRYKIIHQTRTLSPSQCAVGLWIVVFLMLLNIHSLGMVAIERYKAVKNINSNKFMSGKTVLLLVLLCLLTSSVFTISYIKCINYRATSCNNFDSFDIHKNPNFVGVVVSVLLTILSTFSLTVGLYVKICIILRSRIGPQPDPIQQIRTENREQAESSEDKTEQVFSCWAKKVDILNQATENQDKNQGTSDGIHCQFVDLQFIEEEEETPCSSQNPNNKRPFQPSIYIIPRSSPVLNPPQPERESVSSCEHIPGALATTWYQLPGTVKDERDIKMRQSPLPKVQTTTLRDSCDSRKGEPVIPDLNNQNQNNPMVTSRVTLMLFVVTLVFCVTYVLSSMMLFLPRGAAGGSVRQFFGNFLLINHAINPVIYSIANIGFRESCINFVHGIRERFRQRI